MNTNNIDEKLAVNYNFSSCNFQINEFGHVKTPRKRKKRLSDAKPSPKSKEMNRIYSRKWRRKRKEYIKTLENKIEELELKVQRLTDQISYYKHRINSILIGDEEDFKDF